MTATLPGDLTSPIAGSILRRGLTVIILRHTPADEEAADCDGNRVNVGESVTVTDAGDRWIVVAGSTVDTCGPNWSQLSPGDVEIVMDDAGCDAAARWLAAHHGLTVGATAPGWERAKDSQFGPFWQLTTTRDRMVGFGTSGTARSPLDRMVLAKRIPAPGIEAITNPAEALRAACMAAGGRATEAGALVAALEGAP